MFVWNLANFEIRKINNTLKGYFSKKEFLGIYIA